VEIEDRLRAVPPDIELEIGFQHAGGDLGQFVGGAGASGGRGHQRDGRVPVWHRLAEAEARAAGRAVGVVHHELCAISIGVAAAPAARSGLL
jgi:hypothetical protein